MQVVVDRGLILGSAAGLVDILDPEQEAVAACGGGQGSEGVAEMQGAGRRRGETGYASHAVKAALARSV